MIRDTSEKVGLIQKASSYDTKPAEELRQHTTSTSRVEVGDHIFLKMMLKEEWSGSTSGES